MANKVLDFQKHLLTDDAARKAFAANPAKYLQQHGITLPANVKPPASIPLAELEAQVKNVQQALTEQHMSISDLPVNDPPAMTRFIENAIPLRTSDLKLAQGLQATLVAQQGAGRAGGPGDDDTVAAIGAVVVAVVAVPVAVYGKEAQSIDEMVQAVAGIEGISRTGLGYTLYGPAGLRVEGLDSAGVVNVIKGLR
jgi:hypothetical protein